MLVYKKIYLREDAIGKPITIQQLLSITNKNNNKNYKQASGNGNVGTSVGFTDNPQLTSNIASAISGNPQAIAAILSDPKAIVNFLQDYNGISQASDAVSVLSANGVSADFFKKYPIASFLDNSTTHWKSRQPALLEMTPTQRIGWYINGIKDGKMGFNDAVQYQEFFGDPKADFNHNKHISDDSVKLTYQIASTWNSMMRKIADQNTQTFIWNDGNGHHEKPLSWLSIDVTKTIDYPQVEASVKEQLAAKKASDIKVANDAAQLKLLQDLDKKITPIDATSDYTKYYLIGGGVLILAIGVVLIIKK